MSLFLQFISYRVWTDTCCNHYEIFVVVVVVVVVINFILKSCDDNMLSVSLLQFMRGVFIFFVFDDFTS
jgi:hypothetical protein